MKKILYIITIIACASTVNAQQKEKREIGGFNGVTTSGIVEVIIKQDSIYSVEIEANNGNFEDVETKLIGSNLHISTKGKMNTHEPKVYIYTPMLKDLKTSGTSVVKSKGLIKTDDLTIISSGASEVYLSLKSGKLTINSSGASEITLTGYSNSTKIVSSGAADINAKELVSNAAVVSLSGASDTKLMVEESITGVTSGAADLDIKGNPTTNQINSSGISSVDGLRNNYYGEDVEIKNDIIGDVIVKEHCDTTRISIGKRKLLIIEDWDKTKVDLDLKDSVSDPYYYGIDGMILGVNGFLNPANQMNVPTGYEFLETDIAKSYNFQLNFLDADIKLYERYITLHPGLGLEFNSYEFRKNYWLNESSSKNSEIEAFPAFKSDSSVIAFDKNRLKSTYLNVPLMLAFHSHEDHKKAFHLGVGGYAGLRVASKMKYKYKLDDDGRKLKVKDDFYLSPFRYGLTASVGYSNINIFANYALNGLFEDKKGPELHPFSVGLMIIGF